MADFSMIGRGFRIHPVHLLLNCPQAALIDEPLGWREVHPKRGVDMRADRI
jgi:hypothetical protein